MCVLFCGQSITEQEWSKQVAGDLRRRFPHADLEIENRAIGGFASQRWKVLPMFADTYLVAEDRRFHEGKRDDSRARHRQRKAHAGDHRRQPRVPAGDCNRKNVSPANEGGLILPSSCLSCSRALVVGSLTIGNA